MNINHCLTFISLHRFVIISIRLDAPLNSYDAWFRESAPLYIVHCTPSLFVVKLCILIYSMVLFSIVLSFFCVLIFYCFNKRISVSPKPGMVYFHLLFLHEVPVILEELISKFSGGSSPP